MKPSTWIVLRPVGFLISLILVVLSLAGLLIPLWITRVTSIENEVKISSHNTNHELASQIQRASTLFLPINASAINLAGILNSSLDVNNLRFSIVESKVVSSLFQALSTIPYVSQISYIGSDGLFFAYYIEGNDQLYALYSNSTFSSTQNDSINYTWYMQQANRDTGQLYGEAIFKYPHLDLVNSSWFLKALNSLNGYASVGTGWGNFENVLFLSTVGINGKGAVSLGFSMKFIIDFLIDEIEFYNGSLYLATLDGIVLTQGIPNTCMILAENQVSFQLLSHGDDRVSALGNVTCQPDNGTFGDSILKIWGTKYVVNCSPVEIAGLKLVYVLALPQTKSSSLIHKNIRLAFVLLVLMFGAVVITICSFVYLIFGAAKREMYLCGVLIHQMEATQQSERKSMNKSLAFASASHDIRASLAGITGLIEICRNEVSKKDPLRSEMLTNLQQMEVCTRDFLGILNSILDTSKIEAGKMQLEEGDFDIEQLLEDVVDLFHPVGAKKGVDVILDPYDCSVMKNSCVKGDRGKLKQVLSNLLSNAVKFTSHGHVIVRAWARKPSLRNASSRSNSISCLFCFERAYNESEVVSASIRRDPNRVEFVFEVIDTGKGIPKERQKSVFENYVQVKETAFGRQGTGLGLGIVQSLVRLMGGEIGVVDKEVGERGTCFRFNVFFDSSDTDIGRNYVRTLDIEADGGYISSNSFQNSTPIIRMQSPKIEGSQVILFIQSTERSNILRNFMQRIGIKVHVVNQHEQLSPTLKKIKNKLSSSRHSSSGNSRSDGNGSRTSSTRSKEVPLSALDGVDDNLRSQKKPNGLILVVIDTHAGPFRDICRAIAEFRRDLNENCYSRVVWLNKTDVGSSNFQGLDEDKLPPSDLVISKPFHGSCLYRVIGLLPEFGGALAGRRDTSQNVEKVRRRNIGPLETINTSYEADNKSGVEGKNNVGQKCEIEEVGGPNNKKPLMGKKILIADDDSIGRKIATFVASQLGASVFSCENGEEAWKLVCKSLDDGKNAGVVPFDWILMDCEMEVMDGIEATTRIREIEEVYGVHIPILALTAHSRGEEIDKMIQAGVDGYITKPLTKECFLKAISELSSKI